jgi:hypothetical protein
MGITGGDEFTASGNRARARRTAALSLRLKASAVMSWACFFFFSGLVVMVVTGKPWVWFGGLGSVLD